jgi:hypothetical protein
MDFGKFDDGAVRRTKPRHEFVTLNHPWENALPIGVKQIVGVEKIRFADAHHSFGIEAKTRVWKI